MSLMTPKRLTKDERPQVLGTFKPVGHVLLALPDDQCTGEAARALRDAGFADEDLIAYSAGEAAEQMRDMLQHASEFAGFGYEVTLMRRYHELAEGGCCWLLVYAPEDEQAGAVAEVAKRHGALAADKFHRLVVEDLL